jgi:AraC-like DNA-binding protein
MFRVFVFSFRFSSIEPFVPLSLQLLIWNPEPNLTFGYRSLAHSESSERYSPGAFPILPIVCLILFESRIFCIEQLSGGRLEGEGFHSGVAKPTEKRKDLNAAVIAMRKELASNVAEHAHSLGENPTAIPGLALFRLTRPTACLLTTYEPSLTVFVQGRKRINLGGTEYLCDRSSFLLTSIDVPVESQILEASEQVPLLAMFLRLDMPTVREVLSREDLPESETAVQSRGLAVGETTVGLLGACARLIELLEIPEDIPFLSHLIQREIVYRILRTPQGERLRAIATAGNLSHRTARAIALLRTNYAKPLHMEELAAVARMGVSTLHHQFRALTAMSPLQYQKQLRLQAARQRMLIDGIDATSAAYEVGYESVSQFNREYSRFFGQPPIRDVKALRDGKVAAITAA